MFYEYAIVKQTVVVQYHAMLALHHKQEVMYNLMIVMMYY